MHPKLMLGSLLLALHCAGCVAQRMQPVELQFRPYVGALVTLEVLIDDTRLRMLFDTGAGFTAVVPEVAGRLGCKPEGRTVGWRMRGERVDVALCSNRQLQAGGFSRHLAQLGIFDVNALIPAELPRLDGIVGIDVFMEQRLMLQYREQRALLAASSARAPSGNWTQVPMRIATGTDGASAVVFLAADAPDGRQRWLELDSGNLGRLLLSADSATALGAQARADGQQQVTLRLGGLVTGPVESATLELIHDGALNTAFFTRHDVVLDLPTRKAWIRPSTGTNP